MTMGALFGYRLEPGFDIAKEKRRDRLKWPLIGFAILWAVYLFAGGRYGLQVFQGLFATLLFYGDSFYVRRKKDLGRLWLWKAILVSIPLHVLYLTVIFCSDRAFPGLMMKSVVFMPVLALGFAIESIQMDKIIDRFKPSSTDPAVKTEKPLGDIAKT